MPPVKPGGTGGTTVRAQGKGTLTNRRVNMRSTRERGVKSILEAADPGMTLVPKPGVDLTPPTVVLAYSDHLGTERCRHIIK